MGRRKAQSCGLDGGDVLQIAPVRQGGHPALQHLTTAQLCDMVEQLAAEVEQEATGRCAAEDALRLQEARLSASTHDLMSSASVLMIALDMLASFQFERAAPPAERRRLELGRRSARHMFKQLQAWLDDLEMAHGQLHLHHMPLQLHEVVAQAVRDARETAPEHAFDLALPDEPVVICGDVLRLRQALDNLLGNAVKYSAAGTTVAVALRTCCDQIEIEIADQGIGIPSASLPHLFGNFYRAPNAERLTRHGMGIGLFIVHEIVTAHGGTIHVSSHEAQGSTFTVVLPHNQPLSQS